VTSQEAAVLGATAWRTKTPSTWPARIWYLGHGYLFARPVSPEAIADLVRLAPGRAFQVA
jgi:hypothetical protein